MVISVLYKAPPPVPERFTHFDSSVNYLDLDHGASSEDTGTGKSPSGRSSTAGSDYKEIDWVKTKALNETRIAVESKRKGSEKSVDG
jgi:hypothetical protein